MSQTVIVPTQQILKLPGSIEIPVSAFEDWKFILVSVLIIIAIPVSLWIKGKFAKRQ